MTQCLLTLLLVPGLHEHHLLVFVPRSVGSVGAGDAPCPRGGWLDTTAAPAAPATVLHNGDTLPRPFVAALGSPQTLTTWSQPALSMPHDRSSLSLSLSPPFPLFHPSSLLSTFRILLTAWQTGLFLSRRFLRDILGPVSLRERISSVKERNASDPGWRASKQRPNNRDDGVSFRSTAASAARRPPPSRRRRCRRRRRRRGRLRRRSLPSPPLSLLLSFHSTTALFFRRSTLNLLSSIEDARTCRPSLLSPARPLPLFSFSYEK